MKYESGLPESTICIVGMALRFPGANSPEQFWSNLERGVDSISRFSKEQLLAEGVAPSLLAQENYVPAAGVIPEYRQFDPQFFGISVREAELMDPQQRIALECAWEALEDAGYDASRYEGKIGVFAGAAYGEYGSYVFDRLREDASTDRFMAGVGRSNDFLATRVAYKLNLKGPAVDVQTACSTSLVALHLARLSIQGGDCDMCLVGGVSLEELNLSGYLYFDGGILSSDGRCRVFDADANGTVFSTGAGFVVIKKLGDAIRDRDQIHAIVRGTAVNNDGQAKLGFYIPSVAGQVGVVRDALRNSGLSAESISYIEAHGTATAIGDKIEIEALSQAFRADTQKQKFCAIGAVKGNIGHLNHAAGTSGLIKTCLALRHKKIPANLHCSNPNPALESTPFFVNTTLRDWDTKGLPRRAGVTALGIGGTNAHVILEEAPQSFRKPVDGTAPNLFVLSAKDPPTLDRVRTRLATFMRDHPGASAEDVAFTLQLGRTHFKHRIAVASRLRGNALADALGDATYSASSKRPSIATFVLPMLTTVQPGFAKAMYECEPEFAQAMTHCASGLGTLLGINLESFMLGDPPTVPSEDYQPPHWQRESALFCFHFAVIRLMASWGINPEAYVAVGVGEYAAAAATGVVPLDVAIELVAVRQRMQSRDTEGTLVEIPLTDADLVARGDVVVDYLGADVIGLVGTPETANELLGEVRARGRTASICGKRGKRAALDRTAIRSELRRILPEPKAGSIGVQVLSGVTGTWWQERSAINEDYWVEHMVRPMRFAEIAKEFTNRFGAIPNTILLGDRRATSNDQRESMKSPTFAAINEVGPSNCYENLLAEVGCYWANGGDVDWREFSRHRVGQRVALPTYPFNRRVIWFEAPPNNDHSTSASSPAWGHVGAFPESEIQALLDEHRVGNSKSEGIKPLPVEVRVQDRKPAIADRAGGLRTILIELLGTDDIDMSLSFIDVGGDSILGAQFAGKIKDMYGVAIDVEDLLSGPMRDLEARFEAGSPKPGRMKASALQKKVAYENSQDLVERLCKICCDTLKLDEVDRFSTFMDCGGDSISAGEFVWSVRNEIGIALEIDDVLSKPLTELAG